MDIKKIKQCKICGNLATLQFIQRFNTKIEGGITNENPPVPHYRCLCCNFLFNTYLDDMDLPSVYDDNYWDILDPAKDIRVNETWRLILFSTQLRNFNINDKILDFGSGENYSIEHFRRCGLNAWGTDIIEPKRAEEWFLKDLENEKFDIITACEVIEHFTNPKETFEYIWKHLNKNGIFVFQTAYYDPFTCDKDWWYIGAANGHCSFYSKESFDYLANYLGVKNRILFNNYVGIQAFQKGE